MPAPLAEEPRLKYRACVEKREESGSSLTAKGSSKDSSISLMSIERFRLNGGLFQSKSIASCPVYPPEIHCIYFVFTEDLYRLASRLSTDFFENRTIGAYLDTAMTGRAIALLCDG